MKKIKILAFGLTTLLLVFSCKDSNMRNAPVNKSAEEILGNPEYLAISYGGYRENSRDIQPTIPQLKEDLKIIHALGIRLIRTYNVHLPHASNVLQAIDELKKEDPSFEMYVMLGAWIDCKNAWTNLEPNHDEESERNGIEIAQAVSLAKRFPGIVKILAVGNEAMVKWATAYYVQPRVILKWVNHLQQLKKDGELPQSLWITSSDNFASWGGGEESYHNNDLNKLIKAVDYISIHTYPMHDTHYNPAFWGITEAESKLSKTASIQLAMERSLAYAQSQYNSVKAYMERLGVDKPIHIGETGWASSSNELYGSTDSKATDEYKAGIFYKLMRDWTKANRISCFYFEAFDEPWKDSANAGGSENHFGLFTVDGAAKFPLWQQVDQGIFEGLGRTGTPVVKTYEGDIDQLLSEVELPPHRAFETSEK